MSAKDSFSGVLKLTFVLVGGVEGDWYEDAWASGGLPGHSSFATVAASSVAWSSAAPKLSVC